MSMAAGQLVFVGVAGLGAGIVNGVAGGGSLLSFPALLAVGTPALTANVTSTVGIWPGYLGGSAGFRREISGQRDRLRELMVPVIVGSIVGTVLLLATPTGAFALIAPYLIIGACVLFAVQPLLARQLRKGRTGGMHPFVLQGLVGLASVYGSYFGAGLGVLLLAVLGLAIPDALQKVNGLRSAIALAVNTIAAVVFALVAPVAWTAVAVMIAGSLAGGYLGAQFARQIPAIVLRLVVIALGLAAAGRLLL